MIGTLGPMPVTPVDRIDSRAGWPAGPARATAVVCVPINTDTAALNAHRQSWTVAPSGEVRR
jgi:hypothetical protein